MLICTGFVPGPGADSGWIQRPGLVFESAAHAREIGWQQQIQLRSVRFQTACPQGNSTDRATVPADVPAEAVRNELGHYEYAIVLAMSAASYIL